MTVVRNPVIRGFASDPSLIRVGGTYYVATSSFEWFPTLPLFRSRDLATWEYAGHVGGAVPNGSLAGVPDSGGIYAPALSFDGERFWIVYAIVRSVGGRYFDLDTWTSTATDPAGPWSAPRRVPGHGFDPSLFHHDGRLWLVNLQNDHRPGGQRFAGIVLTELDRATLRPLGATHLLLQHDRLIEGPKLLHHDGWFHLLVAEGGTGVEHAVLAARSRSLLGPYEVDTQPLLTSRDDPSLPLQRAGHGELVQAPDGSWFLGHLASRPLRTPAGPRSPLGRETAVQEVVWNADGRPRLRRGGRHPFVDVEVPRPPRPSGEPDLPPRQDDVLGWPWNTLREPVDPSWADADARPGWIRLRGRQGPESLWDQSLLAQRITEHRAEVEVVVDAAPRTFGEAAGLLLWYSTTGYFSLDLTWAEPSGEPQRGQQWNGRGRLVLSLLTRHVDEVAQQALVEVTAGSPVTLGADVDGSRAQFWFAQGGERQPIGPALDFSRLSDEAGSGPRFTGALAAIHAQDLVEASFTADFTGFRLRCREPDTGVEDALPTSS
ncbi:family 43 glycosylhydrolase [Streptomyces sp. NPDC020917]|uniref:family 43 glycosylhydrolase n=1 Tax=Streptomyces sp. NPDC020917 TaxID=3365102 RepID=UPI0037ABAEE6